MFNTHDRQAQFTQTRSGLCVAWNPSSSSQQGYKVSRHTKASKWSSEIEIWLTSHITLERRVKERKFRILIHSLFEALKRSFSCFSESWFEWGTFIGEPAKRREESEIDVCGRIWCVWSVKRCCLLMLRNVSNVVSAFKHQKPTLCLYSSARCAQPREQHRLDMCFVSAESEWQRVWEAQHRNMYICENEKTSF